MREEPAVNEMKKRVAVAIIITVITVWSVYLGTWLYRRYAAQGCVDTANETLTALRQELEHARSTLEGNRFLMTGEAETTPFEEELAVAREELARLEGEVTEIEGRLARGDYVMTRNLLEADSSPTRRAESRRAVLKSNVVVPVNKKRRHRDTAVAQEWLLRARLKHPIPVGLSERPEGLQEMPACFFDLVPVATDENKRLLATLTAEEGGAEHDDRLFNSLGLTWVRHRPLVEHVKTFCTRVHTERAEALHNRAFTCYLQVEPLNDRLSAWYRASVHDGRYTADDYVKLLAEQEAPMRCLQEGDDSLRRLREFYDELHEQHYVYVSAHRRHPTTFRHTRSVPGVDSKGKTCFKQQTYYTDGYKYGYVLTTVRSVRGQVTREDREVHVGEVDSLTRGWTYHDDERVGYVREWKRLHEDNTMIRRMCGLANPSLEEEDTSCGRRY